MKVEKINYCVPKPVNNNLQQKNHQQIINKSSDNNAILNTLQTLAVQNLAFTSRQHAKPVIMSLKEFEENGGEIIKEERKSTASFNNKPFSGTIIIDDRNLDLHYTKWEQTFENGILTEKVGYRGNEKKYIVEKHRNNGSIQSITFLSDDGKTPFYKSLFNQEERKVKEIYFDEYKNGEYSYSRVPDDEGVWVLVKS